MIAKPFWPHVLKTNPEAKGNPMSVTIFTKPACVQCDATKKALDKKQIDYETIDLTQDAEAMEKVQSLGYRSAPVVITDTAHWSGFRPDMIQKIAS